MAQYYNIKQYQAGGEWKSPYGMLDSFFLEIEGHESDTVMTNKKQGNVPRLGQIYGELIFKKVGKKGQNVYQFKQLEAPEGAAPASAVEQSPVASGSGSTSGSTIPEWFAPYAVMIHKVYEQFVAPSTVDRIEPEPKEEPKPTETIPGTNLTKEELEDIFGGSMDVKEI